MRFRDLFGWHGTLGRGPYALAGVGLFAVKYLLDRIVSEGFFGRPWAPWSYLDVSGVGRITALSQTDLAYCLALVALALPFIWIGTALTVRRLRSAGLPETLVVLFFVPLVNLVFFAVLAVVPERAEAPSGPGLTWLERVVPESRLGSAALALVVTLPAGLLLAWLSAQVFASYGWSLFVGIPFGLGMVAALLYSVHGPRTMGACVSVACASVGLLAGGLAVLAVEGLICLAMAAPLALGIAALGGAMGYAFQAREGGSRDAPAAMLAVVLVVPGLLGLEVATDGEPPLVAVRTAIDIEAPPEVVWAHVVAFAELPPPEDWLFRTGVAYPVRATIEGAGVGAVRRCEFTTGAFVEPITAWEPGRRLAFDVAEQPRPMEEWGLWGDVEPHHLNGYFVSERGQFLLTSLARGGTRLEGTTWYRHRIDPPGYWRLWSDFVLHRIHGRVLQHVKRLAEADA